MAVIFILGSTSSGKSNVAMLLAERLKGSILSMDSMQVYRGLDIGTGKPNPGERGTVPHGGLDLVDPGTSYSVAEYVSHAGEFLKANTGTVLITGGTGLYYRALTQGLCEAPPAEQALRDELNGLDIQALRSRLEAVDPEILPTLDASNPRRLMRAIEVKETTGKSLLDWQKETGAAVVQDHRSYFLNRERDDLRERIARRVRAMFAAGWEDEVRQLMARYGIEAVRNTPAIGYSILADALERGASLDDAERRIVDATRQYARRQATWFKREQDLRIVSVEPGEPAGSVADRILRWQRTATV